MKKDNEHVLSEFLSWINNYPVLTTALSLILILILLLSSIEAGQHMVIQPGVEHEYSIFIMP
ncbi:hypothetical protein [Metabacillus malikii]|uniref:Uncharacterized protein n=1 Tax=Metabacillus malikii TaxID=1504265 RepID=A0ABT9ZLS4_9BACI|nr:hypothetical protein [Metabacillus malikii]MDQ0232145.1 hypothetical protein [Metabacillus malikii]